MAAPLKIRWAPKVRPEKIRRLYLSDASGLRDEDLLNDVGITLLLRCEAILLGEAGKMKCPGCGTIVHIQRQAPAVCTGCGWSVPYAEWVKSRAHRELGSGQAGPAFERFSLEYPNATTAGEKMIAIDQLIHAFHRTLEGLNRSAANNLIEGSHRQVLELLDQLSYGDRSTPGLKECKPKWRENVDAMMKRRGSKWRLGQPGR